MSNSIPSANIAALINGGFIARDDIRLKQIDGRDYDISFNLFMDPFSSPSSSDVYGECFKSGSDNYRLCGSLIMF